MKKITILAFALFISQLTFSQGYLHTTQKKMMKSEAVKVTPITDETKDILDYSTAIWYEDFDTEIPATFTINDYSTDGGQLWAWTNAGPQGPYATAPLVSTTAANGWAIYDSDVYCGPDDDAVLNLPEIDLTGYANVKLTFEENYRKFYDVTTVEVSNNGVDYTVYEVNADVENNSSSANPELVEVNISSVAGNQAHVFIRFRFFQNSSIDCAYSWQIDDIAIFELASDDLVLEKIYPGFYYTNGGPYSKMPLTQLMGVSFSADVLNFGSSTQTNTALNVTVSNGTTDVYDVTGPAVASLLSAETDSIGTDSVFVPEEVVADYVAVFNVLSDAVESTPANNTDTLRFSVTTSTYSRWFDYTATTSPSNYVGSADGDFIGYSISMFNADEVKSISFYLHSNTIAGTTVIPYIYENSADDIIVVEGDEYDITEADIANGWVTLEFPDLTGTDLQIDPAGGMDYIIGLSCYWGSDEILFGADDSPFHAFNYTSYLKQADGWGWINRVPMFELTMATPIPLSVENNTVINNVVVYPNPTQDFAEISFDLAKKQNVNVTVFDMTGKVVYENNEGNLPAGKRTVKIDVSNFSTGIYNVQLNSEGNVTTQKIIKK